MNHPHFNITVEVDVTDIVKECKKQGAHMTSWIAFYVTKAAMAVKEMCWRIRDGQIVEHETLTPSYTVQTDRSDVFSFCSVDYDPNRSLFLDSASLKTKQMLKDPEFEDEKGKDNYLFLSSIPWLHFTSIQHAMHYHPCDSVPRITWGKFSYKDDRITMPIAVQVHHALMDAHHVAQFINNIKL